MSYDLSALLASQASIGLPRCPPNKRNRGNIALPLICLSQVSASSLPVGKDVRAALRTALKKTANLSRLLLLSVLNCLLLNPVIFFQSNRVFKFLANFREDGLVHSRAACFFEPYKEVFYAFEHCRDRTDRVVHHLVAHGFQFPDRKDGPPKPVSFTVDENQGCTHYGRCFAL